MGGFEGNGRHFLRLVAFLSLTLALLLAGGASLIRKATVRLPQDGLVCSDRPLGVTVRLVRPSSPGERAGIAAGDTLLSLDGIPLTDTIGYARALAESRGRPTHVYSLLREGRYENRVVVTVEEVSASPLYFVLAAVGLASLLLGAHVGLFARVPRDGLLLAATCYALGSLLVVSPVGLWDNADVLAGAADDLATVLFPPFFLAFCLFFPSGAGDVPPAERLRPHAAVGGAAAASFALLLLQGSWYAGLLLHPQNPFTTPTMYNVLRRASLAWLGLALVLGGAILAARIRRAREPRCRQQLLWVGLGALVGGVPPLLFYFIPYLLGQVPGRLQELSLFTLAWIPVAFSRAVLRHRLADAQIVFKRSLVYATSTALTLFLLLAGLAATRHLPALVDLHQPGVLIRWASAALAASLLLFPRLRDSLMRSAGRLQYGARYSQRRQLAAFDPFRLDPSLPPEELVNLFLEESAQALGLEKIAFFPPGRIPGDGRSRGGGAKADSPAPAGDTAIPGRPSGMRAVRPQGRCRLSSPEQPIDGYYLFLLMEERGGEPLGTIGFGAKKERSLLSHEDLAIIQPAAELLALALENHQLNRRIVERERLASLGRLAAGVAHEINTPLAGISSYAEMLRESLEAPPDRSAGVGIPGEKEAEAAQILKRIGEQADRAGKIVSSLLRFSRRGGGEMVPVDLNEVARLAVSLLGHRLGKGAVELHLEVPEEAIPILADPAELQQVLVNLMTNALDAMPGGGTLTLATTVGGGRALARVADTGSGIPEEVRGRVFEPFFTTKATGRGTGLGLSLSRDIIQRHGGEITFHSRPDRGTEFRIWLPLGGTSLPPISGGATA